MLEVPDDVIRLAVCERCVVRVCGKLSLTSVDTSVVRVGFKMAGMSKMIDENICLLFE